MGEFIANQFPPTRFLQFLWSPRPASPWFDHRRSRRTPGHLRCSATACVARCIICMATDIHVSLTTYYMCIYIYMYVNKYIYIYRERDMHVWFIYKGLPKDVTVTKLCANPA